MCSLEMVIRWFIWGGCEKFIGEGRRDFAYLMRKGTWMQAFDVHEYGILANWLWPHGVEHLWDRVIMKNIGKGRDGANLMNLIMGHMAFMGKEKGGGN